MIDASIRHRDSRNRDRKKRHAPIDLQDGNSRAAISVEFGFNCYEFQAQVGDRIVDVIDTLPTFLQGGRRPTHSGLPILFPFPNRIRSGKFRWDRVDYTAPLFPPRPDAIHGYALDSPCASSSRDRVMPSAAGN